MVTVVPVERKSAVLTPSALACLAAIPTINLTAGCAHGCIYCYTRGYSTYPGAERVVLYTNTLEKLKRELAKKRVFPKAVYFSPSSDAFQPVAEVLAMSYDVMQFLLENGVGVAFLTKGRIPDRHMTLLIKHAASVRAQIGLTTLDEAVAQTLEPYAPPPRDRLHQAERLADARIPAEVRLDPIVPGITDSIESLGTLLRAIRSAGIRQIAVSALFLRPCLLRRSKPDDGGQILRKVQTQFYEGAERLRIHAERSEVLALPKGAREDLYARVRDLAEKVGLVVKVCGCKNPDISNGTCNIAGEWSAPVKSCRARACSKDVQAELF